MNLLHPDFGVPELASLTSDQRDRAWRECIHPRTLKFSFRVLSTFMVAASAALGGVLGHWFIGSSWGSPLLAALFAGFGSYLTDWIACWRFRDELRLFLAKQETDPHSSSSQTAFADGQEPV